MGITYQIVKIVVFSSNIISFMLGVSVIAISALGLERSLPATNEHTFFIVGIILSSILCMATLIGCYGVVCELLGANIVFSLFILILLLMQYLQMNNYPTQSFYSNAVKRLENSWRLVETNPMPMSSVEYTYSCCGLYGPRDYDHQDLKIPKSCYDEAILSNIHERGCLEVLHDFYQSVIFREKLCNWLLFGMECFMFVFSVILSALLSNPSRSWYLIFQREPVRGFVEGPVLNHVNSRTNLFSN